MSTGTLICWTAWFFVLFGANPEEAGIPGVLFFYTSLFLAVIGTFSVIGFLLRRIVVKEDEVVFRHAKRTFRQGIFVSIFLILSLILLHQNLLTWWNSLLLLFLFLILESIIFANRKFSNHDYVK